MARYTGSVCRLCRREGCKLFLKGDKCYSEKCTIGKRPTPPGEHGQARQRKMSEYGLQLRRSRRPSAPMAFWRTSSIVISRPLSA